MKLRETDISNTQIVPARKGVAARMRQGQTVTVINTHGTQVVDTWAFNADYISEFMSMEHSRGPMLRLNPHMGDTLLSNHRRPMLTIIDDDSGLCWALLHKSGDRRGSPIPGQTYPTASVRGMPSAVKPFRTATLTWNSAT